MAILTAAVWYKMVSDRFAEIKERKIAMASIQYQYHRLKTLTKTAAAENFSNLFELPVLFYTACLVARIEAINGWFMTILLWLYVITRCAHSWIQCNSTNVKMRGNIYALSCIVLLLIWIDLGIRLVI